MVQTLRPLTPLAGVYNGCRMQVICAAIETPGLVRRGLRLDGTATDAGTEREPFFGGTFSPG
jgi:hypothetical protein